MFVTENIKKMIFIGDTHGNNGYIKMVIDNYDYRNLEMVHVGDFGVGFIGMDQEIKNLNALNEWLKERGLILHVIRGNHDNPHYFDGTYLNTNLKLHPDYTVLNIEDKNILCVGGAISIDRGPRRRYNQIEVAQNLHSENRYHWEQERFVLDREKLAEFRDINVVVTHTAPHYAKPFDVKGKWPPIVQQFIDQGDDKLGDDLVAERKMLDEMYDILNKNNYIEDWFYGHFHRNEYTNHEATLFNMLAINEVREYGNFDKDEEDELTEQYDPQPKLTKGGKPDMRFKVNRDA
jgi:predicted phosphodiesterase